MPEDLMTTRRLLSTTIRPFYHGDRPVLSIEVTGSLRMSRQYNSNHLVVVELIMRDTIGK